MLGPMRSILFVPGTRHDRFDKAMSAGADAVAFDLEDSVEPGQKEMARTRVGEYLSRPAASAALRLVRFNAMATAEGEADMAFFVVGEGHDGILLPKVETPGMLETVSRILAGRSPRRRVPLLPMLESPRAILRAAHIAAADAPVEALLFGAEDFTAQLGVPRTVEGEELLLGRGQIALAAAAVGAEAVDAVYANLADLDGLRRDSERARGLGFRGKLAIHPRQIPVINEVFTPSAPDVDRARRIVEAHEAATAAGAGVTALDGQMIELPIVERARRTIDLATRYGVR